MGAWTPVLPDTDAGIFGRIWGISNIALQNNQPHYGLVHNKNDQIREQKKKKNVRSRGAIESRAQGGASMLSHTWDSPPANIWHQ